MYRRLVDILPNNLFVELGEACGSYAYCALFVRKFKESEEYAREAMKLLPEKHWIATNLAAALLLQGKYTEAEKVYIQYKDEQREAMLDDLALFEKEGVIPEERKEDVARIRKLLE